MVTIADCQRCPRSGQVLPVRAVLTSAHSRYAVLLKQVANFYNTIHEQVIDSQFPMLEAQARSFEALIKHPRGKAAQDGPCVLNVVA